jgi:hypothetical protein
MQQQSKIHSVNPDDLGTIPIEDESELPFLKNMKIRMYYNDATKSTPNFHIFFSDGIEIEVSIETFQIINVYVDKTNKHLPDDYYYHWKTFFGYTQILYKWLFQKSLTSPLLNNWMQIVTLWAMLNRGTSSGTVKNYPKKYKIKKILNV